MPRNGSGTMSRDNGNFQGSTTWGDQAASNATISSSQHDTHDQDLADELTNSVAVDGQSTMSGNLKMGGNKVTGVAAGTTSTDAATIGGTETLTGKTLTSPTITTPVIMQVNDTNGNELFKMTATTSAVNELTVANAATGNAPTITASGGDTNVDLNLVPKGAGNVQIGGVDTFAGPILGTPTDMTNSGADDLTSADYTGIPSWAKKVTIMFAGVSGSGTSGIIIQLGDSDGFETSGYLGTGGSITGSPVVANYTTGMGISSGNAAAAVYHGKMTLSLLDSSTNTWVGTGIFGRSDATAAQISGHSKSLSGALTQVRITHVNGSDTFDAGKTNIQYE